MMNGSKRGAGDPNYIKKMLKSAPKKPIISANAAAGRKPKVTPKSTYVSPNIAAGRAKFKSAPESPYVSPNVAKGRKPKDFSKVKPKPKTFRGLPIK